MSAIMLVMFYVAWMSPLGEPTCSTGLLPCKLPAMETQFVTNPGITDAQFAMEVAIGGILVFWFGLPFLFILIRWLSEGTSRL